MGNIIRRSGEEEEGNRHFALFVLSVFRTQKASEMSVFIVSCVVLTIEYITSVIFGARGVTKFDEIAR